ncbi:MAG TPA: septal ring lytic transglycosylase RlpA family protein [Terriglobales bacterium]|nr:septal ring lytic transglycosylase RlpA family protein [Terriglobales bacterium]
MASWYGPPYHNRQSSNGEIYDMNAMTAAHRTLPLNSVVRVTNLQTGSSALVRVTDRGPFVDGRVIDLSLAAARAIDVWRPGTAPVKLEVMETPGALVSGGRWCVQIGAFREQRTAQELRERLSRRYLTAKVLDFPSPAGDWWVRVRVLNDDRARAEEVARDARADEGSVFLVRLD